MPRELIASAREQTAFRECEPPPLTEGRVRVKSLFAAAKHNTEMSLFKGYAGPRCDCVFHYGPFRDEHVWPETVRVLPDGVPWQAAVCLDPASFALGAVRDGRIRIGDAVATFGLGAISPIALQLCRLAGAYPVIAIDPLENRRRSALQYGADLTVDPATYDAGLEIKKATDNRGALQQALRGVVYLGTIVCGAYPGVWPAGLDLGAEAHMNRPKVVFSRAYSEPNLDYPNWNGQRIFDACWRLLCEGQIDCEPIVQPVVPFDDLAHEYPSIATHPEDNIQLGTHL